MAYEVRFPTAPIERHFEKVLKRLPRYVQRRLKEAIDALAANPRPGGKKSKRLSHSLVVFQYIANYRLRVGDYRVLYDVDDARRIVWHFDIRRRSERTYAWSRTT